MIDFHSHILPGIDDGSGSLEESLRLIAALGEQGAETVAATPHFYATRQTPAFFLERRAQALEQLTASAGENAPTIIPGAEVLYYPGVSRMQELNRLCLGGTDLLLLEMPFEPWSESMLRELLELAGSGRVTVILAHIDRYYSMQSVKVWDSLLEAGVLMQLNADAFLRFRSRRTALRLMREGRVQLLGSDCHNMGDRPPRLTEARQVIEKRLGPGILNELDEFGRALLAEKIEV